DVRVAHCHLLGMRLADSASIWGKPICTALKPKMSAVNSSRQACSHACTWAPAGVCSQPSSAIMDFSDAALSMPSLQYLAVPAFKDNYLWLIHDGHNAAVVDPGDAAPIVAALDAHGLTLTAI